jgi:hypothetical protein
MDPPPQHSCDLPHVPYSRRAEKCFAIPDFVRETVPVLGLRGRFPGVYGTGEGQGGEQGGVWQVDVRGA